MEEKSSIEFKILNHLRYGKSSNGRVGAKVAPTGDNSKNLAWVVVEMIKGADCTEEFTKHYFVGYEVDYFEYREDFNHEIHGLDWDQLLYRTEKYHNIPSEVELEKVLNKWILDMRMLEPVDGLHMPHPGSFKA